MSETQSMTGRTAASGGALASGSRRRRRMTLSVAGITCWSLRHKRLVVGFWLVFTPAGFASANSATKALSQEYSIPGRESYQTNTTITRVFGNGGNSPPLVAVVTFAAGTSAGSPAVKAGLREVSARIEHAVPHARVASFATTGDPAFISRGGRTTFVVAYPPPEQGSYGQSPKAVTAARAALRGVTVAGAPVHLTGLGALSSSTGQKSGLGVLAEGLLGALAFVFVSLLALLPLLTYFTAAERAALALAEAATRLSDRADRYLTRSGTRPLSLRRAKARGPDPDDRRHQPFNRLNATTRQVAGAWG